MAFPPQYIGSMSLRGIAVPASGTDRFREPGVPFASSPAMAIPGIEVGADVPPPLPPPKFLPFGDAPTQHLDFKKERCYPQGSSSSSFATGYGSMSPAYQDDRPGFKRRDTGSLFSDEGYSSYASSGRCDPFPYKPFAELRLTMANEKWNQKCRPRDSLPTEFGLHHNKFQFSAADLQGDCMKKKLNTPRPVDTSRPLSLLTSSISDLARRGPSEGRFNQSLNVPFQLPIHSRNHFDNRSREFSPTKFSPTISTHSAPFHHGPADHRPAFDHPDIEHSQRHHSKRNDNEDASMYGSFAEDTEMDETSSLKRLHIEDPHATAGQKRRAASPAVDEFGSHGMVGPDLIRRRDGANRGSPTPRLSTVSQSTGVSNMATGLARASLYIPNVFISSSHTTASSPAGHRSPGAVSLGRPSPTPSTSPYNTPVSLNPSPRAVTSRAPMHARNASGACLKKSADVQKSSGAKFQGFFMCECCPKKTKKFETREELGAHEAEKQYECSFCGNRFKNKNEAERHQNSLHVRRHSWSCSALVGYYRAFHESTVRPGQADACGYCGEEFPRSGHSARTGAMSGGMNLRQATDQDWDDRIRHLQEIHKFRECNSSKKFYRADHFRQHLKHSHAGTSGKWTNMLENACLIEEEPTSR